MTVVLPTPTPAPPLVDPNLFGVYLHVPFCLTRCHYCDFVTYTGMEGLRRPYAAALGEEAAMVAAGLGPELPEVTSVFVGGGTPTLLPPGDLGRLLARLRELLVFAAGAEVTVEANPETVDAAMAEGLAGAGVTRVSMGAQSFDDRVLAALGRVHDADRVSTAVATLRAAGVPALNLDLIYGGPGEDAGSWAATLEAALARPSAMAASTVSGLASTVTSAPGTNGSSSASRPSSRARSPGGSRVGVPPPTNTLVTAAGAGPRAAAAMAASSSSAAAYGRRSPSIPV